MNGFTRDQKGLLLYLESRSMDHRDIVNTLHMSHGDLEQAAEWAKEGFLLAWRRLPWAWVDQYSESGMKGCTHFVKLSAQAVAQAHQFRQERADFGAKHTEALLEEVFA